MSARVHCSAEVLAVTGPAVVDRARAVAGEFNCARCGRAGDARSAPANLIAARDGSGVVVLQLVHQECGASLVADVEAIGVDDLADGGADVTSHALLFPGPATGQDMACLIIDTTYSLTRALPSGDLDDFLTGALLARGWQLLTPAAESLPFLDNVVVDTTDRGGRVVLLNAGSDPEVVLDRLPHSTPQWRAAVTRGATMMLLAGRAGGAPMDDAKFETAIASGALVGCFAAVV